MIFVLGINHKTASQDIREKVALSVNDINEFSELLRESQKVQEVVALSTCNRTEIYVYSENYTEFALHHYLLNQLLVFKQSINLPEKYFYQYQDHEAIQHLFAVCAGLDSMIVGEDQIIGQVKEAYTYSSKKKHTGPILNRLFQKAFEAGKRVRTETEIKCGSTSMSYVAVDVCKTAFNGLNGRTALLIGAGDAASIIAESLHKQNIAKLFIANRSKTNANKLAEKYNAKTIELSEIENIICECDCIISAISTDKILIEKSIFDKNKKSEQFKNQVFVDISLPHNIDKNIREIEGVQLYLVDDLEAIINENTNKRLECIEPAEIIIKEVSSEFIDWQVSRNLQPTIQTITESLKKISRDEINAFNTQQLPGVEKAMNEFSDYLTLKYTRHFIKNLRKISNDGKDQQYINMINDLFKISG